MRPVWRKPGTPTIPKSPVSQNPSSEWLRKLMCAEAGSRCRIGEDKDVSTSYAISWAHDKTSGQRESRQEIRSGTWKLLEIKETPLSAEIVEVPVRRKGSRWISHIAGKSLAEPRTPGTWRSQITPPYRCSPIMTNPLTIADRNRWKKDVVTNQQENSATTGV